MSGKGKVCGQTLRCAPLPLQAQHRCTQEAGHAGSCNPCPLLNREPLTCACGKTTAPPLTTHAAAPACRHPCRVRRRRCGHENVVPHECHSGPCPPCAFFCEAKTRLCGHPLGTQHPCHADMPGMPGCPPCVHLTVKPCMCHRRKPVRYQRCGSHAPVSCGEPCGLPFPCGVHACARVCHPPQECSGAACPNLCLTPKACGRHRCMRPCHGPDCEASSSATAAEECTEPVPLLCACGKPLPGSERPCNARDVVEDGGAGGAGEESLLGRRFCPHGAGPQKAALVADNRLFYPVSILRYAADHAGLIPLVPKRINELQGRSFHFHPMRPAHRAFVHALAELAGVQSESLDPEGLRSVRIWGPAARRLPSLSAEVDRWVAAGRPAGLNAEADAFEHAFAEAEPLQSTASAFAELSLEATARGWARDRIAPLQHPAPNALFLGRDLLLQLKAESKNVLEQLAAAFASTSSGLQHHDPASLFSLFLTEGEDASGDLVVAISGEARAYCTQSDLAEWAEACRARLAPDPVGAVLVDDALAVWGGKGLRYLVELTPAAELPARYSTVEWHPAGGVKGARRRAVAAAAAAAKRGAEAGAAAGKAKNVFELLEEMSLHDEESQEGTSA